MASLWNLDACTAWLAQKFPGIPKTSNQFYRAVLTPRNLAAQMKGHDHKIFDFIKLAEIGRFAPISARSGSLLSKAAKDKAIGCQLAFRGREMSDWEMSDREMSGQEMS